MSEFKIRVKAGDVEIEYTDNAAQSDKPRCVNTYFLAKSDKRINEHFFYTIEMMAKEVGKLNRQMYSCLDGAGQDD